MTNLKDQFINFLIKNKALQFGEFHLKSGRVSPYFFNLGVFHTGESLATLGRFYAKTLENADLQYDILFGPAYKGIPLVTATSIILSEKYHKNVPYCFNRKEAKDHGEGGSFVGAELSGKVVMLDDVITAGTTVREMIALLKNTNAQLSGMVIAFDRQECGEGHLTAVQETIQTYHIPVKSIITLSDVLLYLKKEKQYQKNVQLIEEYMKCYGNKE